MSEENKHMSRRGLLRGDWFSIIRNRGAEEIEKENEEEIEFELRPAKGRAARGKSFVHRPPHAVAESEFVAGCTRCDACIQACPPHALYRAPEEDGQFAGFPILDAESQPCLMCDDLPCVTACEASVLRFEAPAAMALAKVDSVACLAFRGTVCTVCVERCPVENAITLEAGRPVVDADICTGCGVCQYVCPAPGNAILLLPSSPSNE